ncbi:hypothetical protein [Marinobacter orientalis]|uniref:Uncharacterized protein n=1 Tax=Marinobacter orientalis TaxID=1928859 RepID=A0A7Y0RF88_9GAMM|nr:hypothetical protein [Marinobacter orientalis]NMT65131.1 hypothetical protein [Marinobacter orientalis]TGX48924.1 hypothetical protein DIT72_12970 [Marinobacter orientalis]
MKYRPASPVQPVGTGFRQAEIRPENGMAIPVAHHPDYRFQERDYRVNSARRHGTRKLRLW